LLGTPVDYCLGAPAETATRRTQQVLPCDHNLLKKSVKEKQFVMPEIYYSMGRKLSQLWATIKPRN